MSKKELKFDANLKWLFTEIPFEERFDAAAAAGFRGVEYSSPYEYAAADLRRRLTDAGLEQVLINSPLGPSDSETQKGLASFPSHVSEFRDSIERGLEYAVELQSTFLHVVAGVVPQGVSRDRAFARYLSNVAWAADRARGTDVILVLETQNQKDSPGFVLETQEQAAAVVEAVGLQNVGVLFDIYHAQLGEGNVANTFEALRSRISHVQIADAPHRNEPGTGELNWAYLFDTIAASEYSGWIGCEYAPIGDTMTGLTWMTELDQ